MTASLDTDQPYDVLLDNADNGENAGRTAERRKLFLGALVWLLSHEAGRLVFAELLRRQGAGLPVYNEPGRTLHNHALDIFRDMREANAPMAWQVLANAINANMDPACMCPDAMCPDARAAVSWGDSAGEVRDIPQP